MIQIPPYIIFQAEQILQNQKLGRTHDTLQ